MKEQESYTITQIKKYEEIADKEEKKAVFHTFAAGISAAATIYLFNLNEHYMDLIGNYTLFIKLLGMFTSTAAVNSLKEIVRSIGRKNILEDKIDTLKEKEL